MNQHQWKMIYCPKNYLTGDYYKTVADLKDTWLFSPVHNTVLIAFGAPGNADAEEPARENEDTEELRRPGDCSQQTEVGCLAPSLLLSRNQFLWSRDRGFLSSPARGRTDDDREVWDDCLRLRLGPAQFLSRGRAGTPGPHYTNTKCSAQSQTGIRRLFGPLHGGKGKLGSPLNFNKCSAILCN